MVRLEKSEALDQIIRHDDIEELAIPTWTLMREAIQAGKVDEALAFMDYGRRIFKETSDSLVSFINEVVTHLAKFGEEEIYEVFRKRYYPRAKRFVSEVSGVKEILQYSVERHRAHGSNGNLKVREEPDRYVVTLDPCGTGGKLKRTTDVATVKKAYPWTWGKTGVPYYCTHCCVFWEILPTELCGYPLRINLVTDNSEDPCIHLFYKKPELIPEEYFTRIGMTKTIK